VLLQFAPLAARSSRLARNWTSTLGGRIDALKLRNVNPFDAGVVKGKKRTVI